MNSKASNCKTGVKKSVILLCSEPLTCKNFFSVLPNIMKLCETFSERLRNVHHNKTKISKNST